MFKNVIPQRSEFFSLLTAHADRLSGAANATLRLMTSLGNPNVETASLIEEVNVNETSADAIKDDLIHRLYESFTTPINRDQLHTLALDLDRVVDSLQSVANSVATHHIEHSTSRAREMASLGADACIELHRAVIALGQRDRVGVISTHCREIEAIESRGAEVTRDAVRVLFEAEGDEAAVWHAMKMRGLYFMQEAVLDHCKRAARTLEEIVLENA
jgi:hypothetical protein